METAKMFDLVFAQLIKEKDEKKPQAKTESSRATLMLEVAREVARDAVSRRLVGAAR